MNLNPPSIIRAVFLESKNSNHVTKKRTTGAIPKIANDNVTEIS